MLRLIYVKAKRKKEQELLYIKFSNVNCDSNEIGRKQFFDFESKGIVPENKNVFFECLCDGKRWFSVQQEMIRKTYLTQEWDGLYSYFEWFKGERFMLRYIFSWLDNIPEWMLEEGS